MEQTSKLKEMQTNVAKIVKLNSTKYLYAGGAVLDAYYGTSFANDVDVFVPYHPNLNIDPELLDQTKYDYVELDSSKYIDILTGVFKVFKLANKKTFNENIDIVYMHVPNPNISMEDFHKILVKEFDIVICSLAWDGNNLYYPPPHLADLKEKKSVMRFKECRLPAETTNPRHDVHVYNRRLTCKFARFDKYQDRGFQLTHELIF